MYKKEIIKQKINPFPQTNLRIDNKVSFQDNNKNSPTPHQFSPSSPQKDEEFEELEELKDNIAFLDFIPNSRKPSRTVAKNPYSILQQPILKRFSNNLSIRDSLTPRGSNAKYDQVLPNFVNRMSDLVLHHSDSLFVSPRNNSSIEEQARKKTRIENEENHSIYEGKSRTSLTINIDDYLKSFSLNTIMENEVKTPSSAMSRKSKLSDKDKFESTIDENVLKNINNVSTELANEEKKNLYEYLVDFMVMSIEGNEAEDDDNFMIDEETEKMQKELNDIQGLYKKLKGTGGIKECEFLQVTKMNDLEKIKIDYEFYPDQFPFLRLRKNLLMLAKGTNILSKKIVSSKIFEVFSLVIILMNSLSYSMRNNKSNQYGSYSYFFDWAEDYFLFFYTGEMFLKFLAFGLVYYEDSYFRDGWNLLDFFVIVGLYLSYAKVEDLNFSLLRLLRLLRPLTTSAFKGLRIILYSLFSALPLLFICFCILNFFFSVFAIGGLQVFSGILKYRCFDQSTGLSLEVDDVCGNLICQPGYICGRILDNPYENMINFDNLFNSYLMTLETVTLDNWSTIMYFVMRAYSNYAWIYHVTLAIFGNFFLLNLLLAVIKVKFGESHEILSEENKNERNENDKKYIELNELKKEGIWEGHKFMKIIKVNQPNDFKNWMSRFYEMMRYYIFEQFKTKTRVLSKKGRRRSSVSPSHNVKNLKQLGFPLNFETAAKKRSTLANINKYTSRILSFFVVKDKNLIRKKSSKIDKTTNPKYLKLRVDHKRPYDALSKDEVMELSKTRQLEEERRLMERKKQKQKILLSLKKNKNYFLDLLRDLNKKNQKCVRTVGPETAEMFTPPSKKDTKKYSSKVSRYMSQEEETINDKLRQSNTISNNFPPNILDQPKFKEKSHLALIPSSRMRNSALMKVKMSTQIDDNEAYVLTFKSSPTSNSRSMSKSQTHTYSILGHSGSKVVDNTAKNSIGLEIITNKIRNKNFKMNAPEYMFMKALINGQIDMEGLAEKEKYVEDNMNYKEKYYKIITPDKNDGDITRLTWSAQDILVNYALDKFEKILEELNLHKLEQFVEEMKFKYRRLRKKIHSFLKNPTIEKFFLLNTISYILLLAMIGILPDETIFILDVIYNIIFTVEIILKFIAFGIKNTLSDVSNCMDLFITILSYSFLILQMIIGQTFDYSRYIYTFKVFRVSRLFYQISFIQTLLSYLSKAFSSFIYLLFLLLIFNFVYALIGMQLFGGRFNKSDFRYQTFNYDTFWISFITTFDIITLDNWIDINTEGLNSSAGIYVTGVYTFSWVFLGNFVLLNLFLAILLESVTHNLSDTDLIINKEDENEEPSNQASLKFVVNKEAGEKIMDELSKFQGAKAREFANSINIDKMKKKSIQKPNSPSIRRSSYRSAFISIKSLDQLHCENSLFFFSKTSKVRILSYRIVSHTYFEHFMNVIIFLSSLILIMETYLDYDSTDGTEVLLVNFCTITNIILACVYFLEIILKGIVFGMFLDRRSYLRNGWNLLDFVLSICYICDTFTSENSNNVIVKAIKVLKVFRPVKIIIINQNIRITVSSLLVSAYSIANVMGFILVVWLFFAILGTIMFRDRFGYCENQLNFGVNKETCLAQNQQWIIYVSNFDGVFNTLLTLFVISSLDGWCAIMLVAINSDIDTIGPHQNSNEYTSYSFFLIFILIGTLLVINLFMSVIFMDFVKEQKRLKHKFLTDSQVAWINIQTLIIDAKPDFNFNRPPKNRFRRFIFFMFSSWASKVIFNVFIILDIGILSSYYDSASKQFNYNMELIHFLFNIFFLIEFGLKLIAFGRIGYFHDVWNKFEFLIVLTIGVDVSVFTLYQNLFLSINYIVRIIQGARALKILRLLKLFYKVKSVQKLLQTLKLSLPMVFNIFVLLMLIYYIYVIFGCIYFKQVTTGNTIDDYINFKNFAYGLMTLFKVSTGDGWEGIMYDIMVYHDWAWVYFLSLYVITTNIMINLIILVLLNQFDDYYANSENPMHTFKGNLEKFRKVWSLFTVKHEGKKMHKKHIMKFFKSLQPPLGYQNLEEEYDFIYKEIMQMNLKNDNLGFLYFNDVLFGAMKKAYHNQVTMLTNEISKKKIDQIERKTLTKLNFIQKTNKSYKLKKTRSIKPGFGDIFEGTTCVIFNPLYKYLFGKLSFLSWKKYTETLLEKITRCDDENTIYFEEDSSCEEEEEENREDIHSKHSFSYLNVHTNKHYVSKSMTPLPLS